MNRWVCIPGNLKKPKTKELSVAERVLNRRISGVRMVVEHVIAGVKRCRMVKEVFRLTTPGASALVMEIAGGLHNRRVDCRHPVPGFNVQSLLNGHFISLTPPW